MDKNVEEYIDLLNCDGAFDAMVVSIARQMISDTGIGIPDFITEACLSVIKDTCGFDSIREELIAIYTDIFSIDEICEMLAFRKSDVGIKHDSVQDDISSRIAFCQQTKIELALPKIEQIIDLYIGGNDKYEC